MILIIQVEERKTRRVSGENRTNVHRAQRRGNKHVLLTKTLDQHVLLISQTWANGRLGQRNTMLHAAQRLAAGRQPLKCLSRRLVVRSRPCAAANILSTSNGGLPFCSSSDREKQIEAELARAPPTSTAPHITRQRNAAEVMVNRSGLLPTRMSHAKDDRPRLEGLARELEQMIMLNGPITVAEYMMYALQHPTHGYYMRREDKIGKGGDFITAPEISQVRLCGVIARLLRMHGRRSVACKRKNVMRFCGHSFTRSQYFNMLYRTWPAVHILATRTQPHPRRVRHSTCISQEALSSPCCCGHSSKQYSIVARHQVFNLSLTPPAYDTANKPHLSASEKNGEDTLQLSSIIHRARTTRGSYLMSDHVVG